MSIDPKLQTCVCGYSWKPSVIQKILMLLFGGYTKTCPRCQTKMELVLIHHVVVIKRESIDKKSIWRNG